MIGYIIEKDGKLEVVQGWIVGCQDNLANMEEM